MPMVYLRNELYDSIIKAGKKPTDYINDAVEKELAKESGK